MINFTLSMFEEAELRPKLNKLVYETYTDCIVGQLNSLATFNMCNNLNGQDVPYIIFSECYLIYL